MKQIFILLFILFSVNLYASDQTKVDQLLESAHQAKKNKEKIKEANIYSELAQQYINQKSYGDAEKYLEKSISIYRKNNKKTILLINLLKHANVLQKSDKNKKAIEALLEAKDISIYLHNDENLVKCYKGLAVNYRLMNDSKNQNEYLRLLEAFDKSKLSSKLQSEVKNLNNNIEKVENELSTTSEELGKTAGELQEYEAISAFQSLQLKILDKENNLKKAELEKKNAIMNEQKAILRAERLIRTILIGGISVLFVLAGLVLYGYGQKKKDNLLITYHKERITDSINYAKKIQEAMLPNENFISKYLKEYFIFFRPKDIVSGDFYWFHEDPTDKDSFYISAVDCTGHGVPGAFMSMIGINQLNEIISKGILEVDEILNELHSSILNSLNDDENKGRHGMDMSLCRVNKKTKTIDFAGARNPLVKVCNNEIEVLIADKKSIGESHRKRKKQVEEKKYTKKTTTFDQPSTFYLFSDGYADQLGGEEGEKFMTYNFYEILKEIGSDVVDIQKNKLIAKHDEWKGEIEQLDDVVVIGFKLS